MVLHPLQAPFPNPGTSLPPSRSRPNPHLVPKLMTPSRFHIGPFIQTSPPLSDEADPLETAHVSPPCFQPPPPLVVDILCPFQRSSRLVPSWPRRRQTSSKPFCASRHRRCRSPKVLTLKVHSLLKRQQGLPGKKNFPFPWLEKLAFTKFFKLSVV